MVAPFASGGLDVRSRALASRLAVCDHVWTHLHYRDFEGDCDGLQGYFLALCLDGAPAAREVTALHLPELKFHPSPASEHSSVLHPHKSKRAHNIDGGSSWWLAKKRNRKRKQKRLTPLPELLPLAYTLHATPGGQHLTWRPDNLTAVANFLRYHGAVHSLCQHVPCL